LACSYYQSIIPRTALRESGDRPGGDLQSIGGKVALHLREQPAAEIMGFEQMAKTAHRGFVGRRLMAEIDPDKPAHRLPIVNRLFHRRVRQVEPVPQKIN